MITLFILCKVDKIQDAYMDEMCIRDRVNMPEEAVSLNGETITRETKLPVRYAYNYCTLSYAMAFWGEEEWRNELYWLALNGAVSYTHLDVYKRQVRTHTSSSAV